MADIASVLGSILGGHDEHLDGEARDAIVGALAEVIGRRHHHSAGPHLPAKPAWRDSELAPGVEMPGEGLHPLPLTPLQNGGIFQNSATSATAPVSITYQGQLQVPFRGERLLCNPSRLNTGGTASGVRLNAQIFVGVALQQAEIYGVDIELLGSAQAFGVRLTMRQAPPGVLLRALVTESYVPTTPDTISLTDLMILGRILH
jgi:hypothetical protein